MKIPKHVAFIVDGNRRWAKARGLNQIEGHKRAVYKIFKDLIYHALKLKIPYLTFWCWSTENWKRGEKFSQMIFDIVRGGLEEKMDQYIKDGIRVNTIGELSRLPKDVVELLEKWKKESEQNDKVMATFALNYGGRDEIVRAINKILEQGKKKITSNEFSQYLDTIGMPDPDLIIRTGGAQRLSGFLPWQSEYSEFYFTKTCFPGFTAKKFDKALKEYDARQRNFGQ